MRRVASCLLLLSLLTVTPIMVEPASAAGFGRNGPGAGAFRGGVGPSRFVHPRSGAHRFAFDHSRGFRGDFGSGRFGAGRYGSVYGSRSGFGHVPLYLDTAPYGYGSSAFASQTVVVDNGGASLPVLPSVAQLPASTGIRTEPAVAPTLYVLNDAPRPIVRKSRGQGPAIVNVRPGGASTVEAPPATREGEPPIGPRIVYLNVPRGR